MSCYGSGKERKGLDFLHGAVLEVGKRSFLGIERDECRRFRVGKV